MKKLSLVFLNVLVIVFIIGAIYIGNIVFFPRELPNRNYHLIIEKNQSILNLANKLYMDKVISDEFIFRATLRLLNKDRLVTAGLYILNNSTSMWRLITRITNGRPDEISITILSGWNINQLRSYIDNLDHIRHLSLSMSNAELQNNLKIKYPGLEGLFFPTTYFIAPGQTDLEIYQQAYKLMLTKISTLFEIRNKYTAYKSPYQLLTMASLIEKETANPQDMISVSTVFNNRLRRNMRLQDDPAVFYGLGNKKTIKRSDFQINTPYNTYLHYGLPPTPICIPSVNALLAATAPFNESRLLYFIAIGHGATRFFTSYKQQLRLIKKH